MKRRIKEAKSKKSIKKQIANRNKQLIECAEDFKKDLLSRETEAEHKLWGISMRKKLRLEKQYIIYIKHKQEILKFYIADLCDTHNKLIFEVDGGYHNTPEQIEKDLNRTRDLTKLGYRVFRISNYDVYSGLGTSFLVNAYRSIGIQI